MTGIVSYGVYVPYWRLDRMRIAEGVESPGGFGTRSVASYDEDVVSMGVEAGRAALHAAPEGATPAALYLATTAPPYLDKTNADTIHAALDLPTSAFAADMCGSVRSAVGALRAGLDASRPTLVVTSDVRTGLPGSADERDGGDGAAAFLFGTEDDGPVLAEVVASASATREFLDRWRVPGDTHSRVWEERFAEHVYAPLADQALTDALKAAQVSIGDVDRLIVTGTSARGIRSVLKTSGVAKDAVADDRSKTIGNTGAAHPGLLLADVLDQAEPDQLIGVVVLADGVDVLLLRTTAAISGFRPAATVEQQLATTREDLPYTRFLTWRGMLDREPPRRPDPAAPAAPPSFRREQWKFAFTGSRCTECSAVFLPPQRVCAKCQAVDRMEPVRMADSKATLVTYSVDRLAYTLSPPLVLAVIDFDAGGRLQCELTDVDAEAIEVGDRLEMSFRRLFTADGVHNYFWKARPVREVE